jgi:hypothetical protein
MSQVLNIKDNMSRNILQRTGSKYSFKNTKALHSIFHSNMGYMNQTLQKYG